MRVETLLEHLDVLGVALNNILEEIDNDYEKPARDIKDAIEQASDFVNEIALKFCREQEQS